MAEQINKNDYINHPDRIGGFNYYSLGETTIKQPHYSRRKEVIVNILKLFVLTIGVNILFIRQTTMSRWHMQTFLIMTAVS